MSLPAADGTFGEYRLWRQGGGRGVFAYVKVQIASEVVNTEQAGGDELVHLGSRLSQLDQGEVAALSVGVAHATEKLNELGARFGNRNVRVVDVQVNLADTEPTALEAAAAAATFDAFGYTDRIQVVFDSGWTCRLLEE